MGGGQRNNTMEQIRIGDGVDHKKFGQGVVTAISEDVAVVDFETERYRAIRVTSSFLKKLPHPPTIKKIVVTPEDVLAFGEELAAKYGIKAKINVGYISRRVIYGSITVGNAGFMLEGTWQPDERTTELIRIDAYTGCQYEYEVHPGRVDMVDQVQWKKFIQDTYFRLSKNLKFIEQDC